jgi:hypothetical protein
MIDEGKVRIIQGSRTVSVTHEQRADLSELGLIHRCWGCDGKTEDPSKMVYHLKATATWLDVEKELGI